MKFYIYGAGIVATTVYTVIKELHDRTPKAFYVSDARWNPTEIDGIAVLPISQINTSDKTCEYLVATPVVHHAAIENSLCQMGVAKEQIIFVDNQLENQLFESYYSSFEEFITFAELLCKSDIKTNIKSDKDITVFQAKCHVDKPLQCVGKNSKYIKPIQVGAALTDKIIAEIRDNDGENISGKNRNYCELTATYYAWKNCNAQYKGLCHYRRIFDIEDEQLRKLLADNEDVDVILPYPTIHYPDIRSQHSLCINNDDWNAMLQAIKEVAPEYYDAYDEVFSDNYFYNYNMLIAKKEIFDDYCQFIFSVLERAEELTVPRGEDRADRFAGYMGENLTTLYFRKNKDKFKIVHVGKVWFT